MLNGGSLNFYDKKFIYTITDFELNWIQFNFELNWILL